ncbi:hypothetical protein LA76x_0576 [Lysobacter antibioticus]|uniref:Uncharacterized protein n=1 Tax=Lysobacter antibioticus TaxID=84531 RepID=A0A0S2F5H7_LYSAN|nr:hypothetical protein LA76x_0576 [Lysobacter antibioticus]
MKTPSAIVGASSDDGRRRRGPRRYATVSIGEVSNAHRW